MPKYIISILMVFGVILFSAGLVYSASFQLLKIGSLETNGNRYSEWWYSGTNPTLTGTGAENSTVSVKVDDNTYTTNSDGSGNWSQALTLDKGDYSVVLSQGSDSYSFTLHLGQNYPGAAETVKTTTVSQSTGVPTTGYDQIFGITFGLGIVLLATYLYIWGGSSKNFVFPKRDLEE